MNPYKVVQDFEQALCDYTGAKYAIAVTSCTMALLLACKYQFKDIRGIKPEITIPSKTYVGVPQSIIHAGGIPLFDKDYDWKGYYQLYSTFIYDSARWFTSDIYHKVQEVENKLYGQFCQSPIVCCSFHWTKHLAIGQGGAILHDNDEADEWFRKARFDGRTEGVAPKDDVIDMVGYHCYMSPRDAAEGLSRLAVLPKHNSPLPNDDYPDLSKMDIFK